MFFCHICQEWYHGDADHHHIKKWAVFHDDSPDNITEVCRRPCHDALEELIRLRENDILRQHQEIYLQSLDEIIGNYELIDKMIRSIADRRAGRIERKRKGWKYVH
jgi:hypothetical protein